MPHSRENPDAEARLLSAIGIHDTLGERGLGALGVAVVGSQGLVDELSERCPAATLSPSLTLAQLTVLDPEYLVIEEAHLRRSRWRRFVDSHGRVHGELSVVVSYAKDRDRSLVVLAEPTPDVPLAIEGAAYLPNVRTEALLARIEFPHPVLSVLQQRSASQTTREW